MSGKIEFIKGGSINGKIVALGLTITVVLMFIAGFILEGVKEGLEAYGARIVEFYGISISVYFFQRVARPGVTAVAKAIAKKLNGKAKVVPEEEGDA